MANTHKYYIVEASALPEIFLKVAETKRLLSTGEASTVNDAARMTGISRSAFYKYRDAILPFQNMMVGRVITFQFLLHDEKGLLSSMLMIFAETARLDIDPAPDTLIRVFMAWKVSKVPVDLPAQDLTAPERTGFTVVEWGGTELP